jgi:tripartite-type tricarboxylate transporter receptor subunit TctC
MHNLLKNGKKFVYCLVFFTILTGVPGLLFAQDYPTKPINLAITSSVGGTVDTTGRILADKVEKILGQKVIVTNNGGGGGSIAMTALAKEKPDGYHIAYGPNSPLCEIMYLRKMPYTLDDFVPIMQCAEPEAGFVVRSDAPWNTYKELIEYARKNPGKVTYTVTNTKNPMALAMAYVGEKEKIKWTAIPVPKGNPNMPLLGGHVTGFSSVTSWKRHVDAGKMKPLVTYGEKRMKAFPDVPTLLDLGYDFVAMSFFMVVAPKGTPPSIVNKLDKAFKEAMNSSDFIDFMNKREIKIAYRNAADTKTHLVDAGKRMEKMIVELNIQKEE